MKNYGLMLKALLSAKLLLLLAHGNAQQTTRVSASVDYTPVDNGSPRVLVHLDEKTTANLLVDSGASRCLISDAVKDKLHVPIYPAMDGDGSPLIIAGKQWHELFAIYMQVGLIQIDKCPFIVLPPNAMENISSNAPDGFIGTNFLLNYATLFDTEKKTLTFWPDGNLSSDDLKSIGFEDATVLPVTFGKDGRYRVHARFNDSEEAEIGIDTGAALTALPLNLVRKLKLKDTAKGKSQNTLFGAVKINKAHLLTLALGKLHVNDFDIQYSNGRDTRGFFPHIGMDVLSHFRFLLDAPAKKLYLKPIEATPKTETPRPNAPASKP